MYRCRAMTGFSNFTKAQTGDMATAGDPLQALNGG
jgi:hypothetical protein